MTKNFQKLLWSCCVAASVLTAPSANSALAAGLPPGGGGGDAKLQRQIAPPATVGKVAINVETLAEGLVNPWSIAFLPDGSILVAERAGRIRVIKDGALQEAPVAGVPEVLAWNQGGLFDVMPHPNFEENNVVFLAYAHGTRKANGLRVARATFDGAALADIEVLYDAIPEKDTGHHFGGRIVWGGDDKLYFTIGEGSKYKEKSQDMTSSFGAVIRLNEDGTIPNDNPDFGDDAAPGLYSKGHRNGQGLAWDEGRQILWETEHGARGGDELNIIKPGANYGWPAATYGIDYNGALISPFTEYEGTEQPVKYWTPSIAPSGLAVYRGDLFADWDGDLLIGAMSGSAGKAMHRVVIEDGEPVAEERYLVDLGERIRDVRVGPDGAIYVTTEDRAGAPKGKVLRLTPQ